MNIRDVKGIGPQKEKALKELDVITSRDLRYHFPRDYEDRRKTKEINQLVHGEVAYVQGKIQDIKKSKLSRNNWLLRLRIGDDSGICEVVFFHAYFLSRTFSVGREVFFYGKVSKERTVATITHPDFSFKPENAIFPIYSLTKGISKKDMLKWQKNIMGIEKEKEYLPKDLLQKNQLMDLEEALQEIHFPKNEESLKKAKNRIVYDELLLFQLGLLMSKITKDEGIAFQEKGEKSFLNLLDYPLTKAQKRVVEEISKDMESPKPMNRLIQGDVGSGKTIVAEICLYKAVLNGYQGCMMAPTEILARQHYETLEGHFKELDVKVGLLSGQMTAKEKRQVLMDLESGEINILVGTHAVIQPSVVFKKLGLVITDEQHRFGVSQREELIKKGKQPDILVMTATPIPRTLAVVLYGDLDVSVIDELPPGRTPIKTTAVTGKARKQVYGFLEGEILKGHQSYVVAPFIEEGEMDQIRSAEELHKELALRFGAEKIALLHGKMKQKEKESIMMAFARNEISVLVATVVIEVGINVPNATVMIIENAERFGLAQLHQLRGRVGRGGKESYCLLVVEGKSDIAMERVKTMKESTDGFYISEKDLSLRGPGEFFGFKQHGIPTLKMADLIKHMGKMESVRKDALNLLEKYPNLDHDHVKEIKGRVKELFGEGERMNL